MSHTAKSVIFDFADSALGTSNYCSVRSIEFALNDSIISVASGDITCYVTDYFSASYVPANAFITSLSKTGTYTGTEWLTSGADVPQRLICVFDSAITFDKVIINNSHDSGSIKGGIKNFVLSISSSAETETDPSVEITSATEIYSGAAVVHTSSDIADPQSFALTQYEISGETADGSNGVEADVHLHIQSTGQLIDTTTSNSTTGAFSFTLTSGAVCYAVALLDGYQALVYNDLTPVEIT